MKIAQLKKIITLLSLTADMLTPNYVRRRSSYFDIRYPNEPTISSTEIRRQHHLI